MLFPAPPDRPYPVFLWRGRAFFLCLGFFLLFMGLVPQSGFAAGQPLSANSFSPQGKEASRIFYGGAFTESEAERLVWAQAWLKGLQEAGTSIVSLKLSRIAGFDMMDAQAMAARHKLVSVETTTAISSNNFSPVDEGRKDITRHLSEERQAIAFVAIAETSRLDFGVEYTTSSILKLYAEVILELRTVLPRALFLAEKTHNIRVEDAKRNLSLSASPGFSSLYQRARNDSIHEDLKLLVGHIEACFRYLQMLESYGGTWEDPRKALNQMEELLQLAPGLPPVTISSAQLLLSLARPSAALQRLEGLRSPLISPKVVEKDDPVIDSEAALYDTGLVPFLDDSLLRTEVDRHVRALSLRALAQLSLGQLALAASDLEDAIALAPDNAELYLSRGALFQVLQQQKPMCTDYHRACVLGLCAGLFAARDQGMCMPEPPISSKPSVSSEISESSEPAEAKP